MGSSPLLFLPPAAPHSVRRHIHEEEREAGNISFDKLVTGLVIIHLWIAAICYTKVDAFNLKSQNSPDLLPKFQGLEGKTEEQALAVGLISGGGRGGLLISSAFWKLCNYKQGGWEKYGQIA